MIKTENSFLNYVFDYIKINYPTTYKKLKVLDYGCGDGSIVKAARECGYNFYRCDNFYEYKFVYLSRRDANVVDLIGQDGILPYESDYFDFIYPNQVFEHVKNLQTVLSELNRVLKKGVIMLQYFPTKHYVL